MSVASKADQADITSRKGFLQIIPPSSYFSCSLAHSYEESSKVFMRDTSRGSSKYFNSFAKTIFKEAESTS
jgi:hypothetical protein